MLVLLLCPFSGNAVAEATRDGFAAAVVAYRAGDHRKALEGWRGLADEGNPLAQYNVGLLHYQGHGTARSYAQALIWFHAAARQGLAASYLRLGAMFDDGNGVPRDFEQAYLWYTLAVSAFGPGECRDNALDRRRVLANKLTEAQVLKVLAESSEWAPGPLGGVGQPCFKTIAVRPTDGPKQAPAPGAKTAAETSEKETTSTKKTRSTAQVLISKLPAKMPSAKPSSDAAGLAPAEAQQGTESTKAAEPMPTVDVAKRKVHTVKTPGRGNTSTVGMARRKTVTPKERAIALAPNDRPARREARAPASREMATPRMTMPRTALPPKPDAAGGSAYPSSAPEKIARARPSVPRRATGSRTLRRKKGVYVQLGALSTRTMANQVWRRLRNSNGDIFGGHQRKIEKMRTAQGRVLFRLYAGPFVNGGKADAFCTTLKERDEPCFVPPKFRSRN